MIKEAVEKLTEILLSLKDVKTDSTEKFLEAKASIIRAITKLSKLEEKK
jgi:hypothetical protein